MAQWDVRYKKTSRHQKSSSSPPEYRPPVASGGGCSLVFLAVGFIALLRALV
jgi:hypothetical protein